MRIVRETLPGPRFFLQSVAWDLNPLPGAGVKEWALEGFNPPSFFESPLEAGRWCFDQVVLKTVSSGLNRLHDGTVKVAEARGVRGGSAGQRRLGEFRPCLRRPRGLDERRRERREGSTILRRDRGRGQTMERSWHCICRILTAATFLISFAFARPSLAGSPVPGNEPRGGDATAAMVLAQASPPDTAPPPPPPPGVETQKKRSAVDRVDSRIQDLHRNLKITAAQEPQWRDFAQVMRDNEKAIGAILKERSASISKMNAVDDLRSYQKLADAHAEGLKKLVPAFEALYNTMSDDQKKNADAVFSNFEGRPRHSKG
jgi:LTXXQ motif family protein